MMKIRTLCPFCNNVNIVEVNPIGFMRWQEEGVSIQNAMPELNANDREMLLSGICPTCWDKMWSEESEEDEDPYLDEEDWKDEDAYWEGDDMEQYPITAEDLSEWIGASCGLC